MNAVIEEKLKLLPSLPGVYKMYDQGGELIYVGKAVSLKNRVRQYFQSSKAHSSKVLAMVSHVADFEYVVVSNETEALTLESNLIKQNQPRYNILLKDDKHFPYVRIDIRRDFPGIEVVRRIQKDGARYLGPYLSGTLLRENLQVVREHFPVRHCKKDLQKAIARRERPCLMYHVGKCCAPCSGNISREEYHGMMEEVISFLGGKTEKILSQLNGQMQQASEALEFERAAMLRDRIRAIEALGEKQTAIAAKDTSLDVFSIGRRDQHVIVFALFVRGGKVIGTEAFRMDAGEDEGEERVLAAFLTQYYGDAADFVPEILLYQCAEGMEEIGAWLTSLAGRKVSVHCPERGEKRKLTELCYRNCMDALDKDATLQKRAWEKGEGALAQLTGVLGLESIPSRMECFDNSHIQGRDTVSSMVVFTDGQPDKKAYRRFRITTVNDGDDIAAMREALTRRFQKARDEDAAFLPLPDLLIVDGGIAQLNAAISVLEELALDYIPAIGLAEQHELIYRQEEESPIALPRSSAALHLLERIRDEAHRFAISYHRSLRQKEALFSVLDEIQGVGEKRKRALFDAFVTLDAMKAATEDELCAVPGMNRACARCVFEFFHTAAPGADGKPGK